MGVTAVSLHVTCAARLAARRRRRHAHPMPHGAHEKEPDKERIRSPLWAEELTTPSRRIAYSCTANQNRPIAVVGAAHPT
jgi:hypothetical protein